MGKLEIKADISEQQFMECCLNMKHSGYAVLFYIRIGRDSTIQAI